MKFYILLVLIALFPSCKQMSNYSLDKSDLIYKVFTKEEVKELKLILNHFDKKIITSTNESNISDAYKEFFKKLKDSESLENLKELINIHDSSGLDIENLKVFDDIWVIHEENMRIANSLTFETRKVIELNLNGKYVQLLKIFGKSNELINDYVSQVENTGYISPTAVIFILNGYNKSDFNNEVLRLIWAIHYITISSH